MVLTEIQLKYVGYMAPFAKKVPDPWAKLIISNFFEYFVILSSRQPSLCKHFYGIHIAFRCIFPFLCNI